MIDAAQCSRERRREAQGEIGDGKRLARFEAGRPLPPACGRQSVLHFLPAPLLNGAFSFAACATKQRWP